MINPAEKLRQIVAGAEGDDLWMARGAFAHLSEEELDKQWGRSGMTCREVLASYEQKHRDWEAARDLLEKLLKSNDLP